jgi:acyl carrier protein
MIAVEQRIFDKLQEIIAEQLGVDPEKVTQEASFIDDLEADSLDMVELIMALEETFGISISDTDAGKIKTVGGVLEYIQSH